MHIFDILLSFGFVYNDKKYIKVIVDSDLITHLNENWYVLLRFRCALFIVILLRQTSKHLSSVI